MHQLLLLAALGSTAAYAKPVKPAGEAVVTGVVEVPLYAGVAGSDPFNYVEATVGETKLFLRLATGQREVELTEAAIGKLGLKATGKEGEKKVKIASLAVGGATFEGVKASVVAPNDIGSARLGVDGVLSLSAFRELAYAIVPSEGVLRLAKGPDGVALVSAIGAAAHALTSWKDEKVKLGTETYEGLGAPLAVPVKWSGVELPASLAIEEYHTWLAREVEGADWYTVKKGAREPVKLPEAPGHRIKVERTEWREIALGGVTTSLLLDRPGKGVQYSLADAIPGKVGIDVLGGVDLAVDPTSGTFSARPITASKRADYAPTYEAALRAALEPKPGKDGEAPTEEQKVAARKGGLKPLVGFLTETGRLDEAITLQKEMTTLAPDDCASWLGLGGLYAMAARPAEAIEPLTKANALYQPWAQLPLAERTDISEKKAAAEKKKEEWTGQIPQPHACHVAPGGLAIAQLQAKNTAAVASLYPAQLDLDDTLPLAAGNAALLKGDFETAQAAYRQALKLAGGNSSIARAGLYLALAPTDFAAARVHLERIHTRDAGHTDPLLVRLYAEGVRQSEGAAGVMKALDALVTQAPSDGVLLAQRGRERAAAGDAKGAAEDWAAAKAQFQAELAAKPNDGTIWARWATVLAAAGEVAEAQKAAETAVKLAPQNATAWLARADAATAAGDAAKAGESRAKAGMVGAEHPAYALLLAQ